ncbi:MAG TPA: 4-alpha-glucanotransferase [Caulobacteraceae bacterium]|jgi:4-alpha-glucanotransferase
MSDAALEALARQAGLQVDWVDAGGAGRRVSPDTLRRTLAALGAPAGSPAEIAESEARLAAERRAPPLVIADAGRSFEVAAQGSDRRARLVLEDGEARDVRLRRRAGRLLVPPIRTPGYHRLEIGDAQIALAVAPRRACDAADLSGGRPIWGLGVQTYALRDAEAADVGDFGALARFAAAAGRAGADLVAISPAHALFAADPSRYSPYAPSTRLFLNPLLADPRTLFPDAEPLADRSGGGALLDWAALWPERLTRLQRLHAAFNRDGGDARRADFEAFRHDGGAELESHALFEALHGHFFRERQAGGWPDWPAAYRSPGSQAVRAFAAEHADVVDFHVFAQWLADRSLAAAQRAAREAGMAVGLVTDLAVGMDGGGSHAWSRPEDLLQGVSVGAPADPLEPSGQDWGIAAFSPAGLRRSGYGGFLATLRAAMRHAGGVRIDHVMGLRRLWVVPHGASPADGVYLTYPFDDLVRLLALESRRHRALVIGEDLGTVPPGFRALMARRGLMGLEVLWFERTAAGAFKAPRRWSPTATAMTSTHDLPTVAGWWSGRDIDWTYRLGRRSPWPSEAAARAGRSRERRSLWSAARRAGCACGPVPGPDATEAAVDAAVALVAATPCPAAIVQAEDLAGLAEQPNLPGTIDEHPNWRRRLPPTESFFGAAPVRRRLAALRAARPRTPGAGA